MHLATATPPAATTQANGCNTPQMANTSARKLSARTTGAETSANSAASAAAAPVNAVRQLGDTFSGLFRKAAPASAAGPASQPAQQ